MTWKPPALQTPQWHRVSHWRHSSQNINLQALFFHSKFHLQAVAKQTIRHKGQRERAKWHCSSLWLSESDHNNANDFICNLTRSKTYLIFLLSLPLTLWLCCFWKACPQSPSYSSASSLLKDLAFQKHFPFFSWQPAFSPFMRLSSERGPPVSSFTLFPTDHREEKPEEFLSFCVHLTQLCFLRQHRQSVFHLGIFFALLFNTGDFQIAFFSIYFFSLTGQKTESAVDPRPETNRERWSRDTSTNESCL